jgi:hypothetical protein
MPSSNTPARDSAQAGTHRLRRSFELRCWARAYLFAAGEFMLWQAIEPLKHDAKASGLQDQIGENEVERIIAAGFGWRHP